MKGTGKWTVQDATERAIPIPTIAAALDTRCLSGLKEERVEAASILSGTRGFHSSPQLAELFLRSIGNSPIRARSFIVDSGCRTSGEYVLPHLSAFTVFSSAIRGQNLQLRTRNGTHWKSRSSTGCGWDSLCVP